MSVSVRCLSIALFLAALFGTAHRPALAYETEPINYSEATPNNRVTKLQSKLDAKEKQLTYDATHGYLQAVLRELEAPVSSQALVFSQTSLQRPKISPQKPRALYFSDEAYVGYVQDGILEVAIADPELGMVFYTLDQHPTETPRFTRETNRCLTCHGALKTRNVPGVQVRSVFVDSQGEPIIGLGSVRVDHTTPLSQRWGGWYVTGTHGAQKHVGNLIAPTVKRRDEIDNSAGQNVIDLSERFDVSPYLSPHSDIVALMVFEHQVDAQNLLTRASFEARSALYAMAQAKQQSRSDAIAIVEKSQKKMETAAEALVRYLLFSGEAPLTESICGTSTFRQDFRAHGPFDKQGRSLRDFDLERRLFSYPCSYLIYSASFDQMPEEMRTIVYRRLWEVLSGQDTSAPFQHLSSADRKAIREILLDTKPNLPEYWIK